MKILIVNPNSSLLMTAEIRKTAEDFLRGESDVVCEPTTGAPNFIETYEDITLAAPGMIQLVSDNDAEYDAFIA